MSFTQRFPKFLPLTTLISMRTMYRQLIPINSNYFDITDFSNTFSSLKKHFFYLMLISEVCQKTLVSFALYLLHLGFHLTYLESLKPNNKLERILLAMLMYRRLPHILNPLNQLPEDLQSMLRTSSLQKR